MWNSARGKRNWDGSRGGRENSSWNFRTGSCLEQTANPMKKCTQIIFDGWRQMTNILTIGTLRGRGDGRFMEWGCRTRCWRRCITPMRKGFLRSTRDSREAGTRSHETVRVGEDKKQNSSEVRGGVRFADYERRGTGTNSRLRQERSAGGDGSGCRDIGDPRERGSGRDSCVDAGGGVCAVRDRLFEGRFEKRGQDSFTR